MLRVGVDTGGTFTDFALSQDGELRIHKVLSTPEDPTRAIVAGLEHLGVLRDLAALVHGSTVATNAVLERKGARTGLVTTAGFRDVLEIGRQNRPRLYDLRQVKPPPLVPRAWRLEVRERLDPSGRVLVPLVDADVEQVVEQFRAAGVESVAVSFLFSFANPEHEQRVADRLREAGFWVSASHEILPEFREYERTSTTVLNAYVAPVMARYLHRLRHALPPTAHLQVMLSNGGLASAEHAARQAARTLLSGPAAGAIGASAVARASGFARVISFDMGGTSTDVCLIDGEPSETSEGRIGPYPVRLPMLDIHTVGAGGGSIAWFDAGGALRVGPQSAGAVPGPACYGRGGEEATVTDADVVLGWIPRDAALGGTLRIDAEAARAAVARIARALGCGVEEAALGIVAVAEATMEGAIRVISVERGHDPREFTLVAFGGAGPLHACGLAARLRIPRVLVPPAPGVLSAYGLLAADIRRDDLQTVMCPAGAAAETIQRALAELVQRTLSALEQEGIAPQDVQLLPALDLRYAGQSFELTIPYDGDLTQAISAFHRAHERRYGYALLGEPVTVVNVRLRAVVPRRVVAPRAVETPSRWTPHPLGDVAVTFPSGGRATRLVAQCYERAALGPGAVLIGPALVLQTDTTVLVPPGWRGVVDGAGAIVLERIGGAP